MSRINVGIIGMGFIGVSHMEAVRRIGSANLVAVTDVNFELARKRAEEYGIPKCYRTIDELLADPEIAVVHDCTPNHMHLEVNKKIIAAGKHVFSEKPLGCTSGESSEMLELLQKNPQIVHGVNFNYRMNPLVQDIKNKIRGGEIGRPRLVHGSYLQDWLLFDTDYNWRIEPEIGGPSRCIADIGSHWMDAVQVCTGAKITDVCADLQIVIPVRKKAKGQVETFSLNTNAEYEDKVVHTEDYGAVLFKMDNGVHGVFYVSQVSAGRKCWLNFEIDGEKSSVYWNQETADQMWMGYRDRNNQQVMRNPLLMTPEARQYTYLAAGHPEGWNDALRNNIYSFYKFIAEGKSCAKDPHDFATFEDGHYIIRLTEAILKSSKAGSWVKVNEGV
ncbi:MAG: Gfo/Idh/MocA family oxidoreductase [Clostridia bacterium]|nr:Gfo/Idh/MocA family oxidoreductase [Clostridia bacterium]